MLPEKRRKGLGWKPAAPLILAAWWGATPGQKRERLREHIEWAFDHDCLDAVHEFLRGLPESEWHHTGE